jgi:heme/copper-type cytochrome/quinol oxidase subunit 2
LSELEENGRPFCWKENRNGMKSKTCRCFLSREYYHLSHKPASPLMNRTQMMAVVMILMVMMMIIIIVIIIYFVIINVLAQRPLDKLQRQHRDIRKIHPGRI